MDELIQLVKTLLERVDRIEDSIEELKQQQRPLSSKDYIHSLKSETATEVDTWLTNIEITQKNIRTFLEEKTHIPLLKEINLQSCMKVFDNNKNSVFCYMNGTWKTVNKQIVENIKTKLFNKIIKKFVEMRRIESAELKHDSIKELSYIEQRGILNSLTTITHTKFRNELYNVLTTNTSL